MSRMGISINYRIFFETIFCTLVEDLGFFFRAPNTIKPIIYKYKCTVTTVKIDQPPH